MSDSGRPDRKSVRVILWIVAVILMMAAVVYQKRTGPTYEYRGKLTVAGESYGYKLIRSEYSNVDARVLMPNAPDMTAELVYRRYNTDDDFTRLAFVPVGETHPASAEEAAEPDPETMWAPLPKQPAAGKLEYWIDVTTPEGMERIPPASEENIIIRFKDPVPVGVLAPHVIMMFFAVLIGMRSGLAAIFGLRDMRPTAWIAFIGMTIGGMVLGPIVQKYAFGAFWTGFPWGYDLTDNKMLIMWLAWVIACGNIGFRPSKKEGVGRTIVVLATVVMMVVYLIPHSMRGSELDYSKVDEGIAPHEAIGTSDN